MSRELRRPGIDKTVAGWKVFLITNLKLVSVKSFDKFRTRRSGPLKKARALQNEGPRHGQHPIQGK